MDMNFHIHFLDNFRHSLWLRLSHPASCLVGHAPLRGLSDAMRDVQVGRLHVHLDPSTVPGELQPLVNSFNTMVGRLEDSFKAGVFLSIQNPGAVIPPEHLPKIFDRFYRVDPSRQRLSEGTGLGLAIAKSIIEAHGGHIEAHSDHDVTRFTISLHPQAPDVIA
ncbi:ATP-binding protein [Dasania sp. GY-19]|uniref:histidine kinase n=2 Tax=Dasania phycosphaerae TaxID=2950436 RepID=A0A9J6RQG0_9GAMM|nr:ATP-binding protein [Dasania phycosphaerae]